MSKCDCFMCAHCGEFDRGNIPMCRYEGAKGPKLPHPWRKGVTYTAIENIPEIGECEGYIPIIQEEDLDIEIISYSQITFKCPFCGGTDSVEGEPLHCDVTTNCYYCGKKIRIYYDNY